MNRLDGEGDEDGMDTGTELRLGESADIQSADLGEQFFSDDVAEAEQ